MQTLPGLRYWSQLCDQTAKKKNMELEAIVNYGSGKACFKIRREEPGIYHASLLYFEGNKKEGPPKDLVLMRGIRYWTGSYENRTLLNDLGNKIEAALIETTSYKKNDGRSVTNN